MGCIILGRTFKGSCENDSGGRGQLWTGPAVTTVAVKRAAVVNTAVERELSCRTRVKLSYEH